LKNYYTLLPKHCCADLHIHSKHSDGSLTPSEIVKICKELKLKTIAIADHDSVSAIDETVKAADDSMEIVPAVELSSNIGKLDIHILGYYIEYKSDNLLSYLESFRNHRIERAKRIVEKLSEDGIELDFERIKEIAGSSSVGRPHLATALREKGYVRTASEAFVRYLGYHSPYYEPKKEVEPKEIIEKIKSWNGVPVIAHPGTLNKLSLIYQLIDDGIWGIEVWHPEHAEKWQKTFYDIAEKNGMLMTGGSDYHGHHGVYNQIGTCGCRMEDIQRLKECWQERTKETF
jgi:hypothetical protein